MRMDLGHIFPRPARFRNVLVPAMFRRTVAAVAVAGVAIGGCASDAPSADGDGAAAGLPTIVVTTTILGDVVRHVVGDLAVVSVVMPIGVTPHEFQASARQIAELRGAGALVVNGANFEEGLTDAIAAATEDGVPTFEAISAVPTLALSGDEADDHDGVDPHFFTDPHRMALVVPALADFLVQSIPELPAAPLRARAVRYAGELDELDREVTTLLAAVPGDRRKLVTNHEVFGYFADRYDFELIGAIIPGGGTQAEPDAAALASLAATIERANVPAIFADTSSPEQLADALASEVGDVEVVELFSESLGAAGSGAATYVELVRTDATRITDALAP